MNENSNNEKRRTVKSVFNTMLRYYIGQMKRDEFYNDGSCEGLYKWIVGTITKELEQDSSRAPEYSKILAMLDRFYKVVTNEEIRNKVKEENINTEEFTKLYSNRILGEFKRKYDMSHKYLKGSVATKEGHYGGIKKDLEFNDFECEPKDFVSETVGNIKIQLMGELVYKSGFGVQNNKINQYKITLPIDDNKYREYYVYSDIDLDKIEIDDEYRRVVLDELLSENNIEFSNSNGYIGIVEDNRNDSRKMQEGEEREEGTYGDYEYQASKNYAIRYVSQDLSAVMDYAKENNRDEER